MTQERTVAVTNMATEAKKGSTMKERIHTTGPKSQSKSAATPLRPSHSGSVGATTATSQFMLILMRYAIGLRRSGPNAVRAN